MSTTGQWNTLLERRIILMTGKGGVGKTTMTAALARAAAARGKRVLALDVDKESNAPSMLLELLSGHRHFDKSGITMVESNLHCARVTPEAGHHQFLRDEIPVRMLAGAAVRSKPLNRFLMAAPGFQEMGLVYKFLSFVREQRADESPRYEFILLDLPATGHTLAFTSLPQVLLQVFQSGPVARTVHESQSYLNNPEQTAAVIVSLPEPLPISETLELVDALERDEVPIGGILVNHMPQNLVDAPQRELLLDYFDREKPPWLGRWSVSRIERAERAMKQLRDGLAERDKASLPLGILEEAWEPQAHLRFAQIVAELLTVVS